MILISFAINIDIELSINFEKVNHFMYNIIGNSNN